MSISQMEQARHAEEKGTILQALKQEFSARMSSVQALLRVVSQLGNPMRPQGLDFALAYLAESGYVKVWRADELPTWRPDRPQEVSGDQIVFARLTTRGLQLVDGEIPPDPKVSFR